MEKVLGVFSFFFFSYQLTTVIINCINQCFIFPLAFHTLCHLLQVEKKISSKNPVSTLNFLVLKKDTSFLIGSWFS